MLKESAHFVILRVTFDAKHLHFLYSAETQRLIIMEKSWQVFHDQSLLLRYFCSFVLPVLEYCQSLLQLQAWVYANGVLKDCMIKEYL